MFPAVCNGRLLSTKSQTFRINRRISNWQRKLSMVENWFARPTNEDIKIWAFKLPVQPHREDFIFANTCTNLMFNVRKICTYWVFNSCKKLFLLPNIMTSKFYGFCKCQLLYVLIKSKNTVNFFDFLTHWFGDILHSIEAPIVLHVLAKSSTDIFKIWQIGIFFLCSNILQSKTHFYWFTFN